MRNAVLPMLLILAASVIGYKCGYQNALERVEKLSDQKAASALIQSHKCELLTK